MAQAEIVVFPFFAEGSARIIFEALASGCIVITTPNIGSVVADGVNGILIPCGDINSLSMASESTMQQRERLPQMGLKNS